MPPEEAALLLREAAKVTQGATAATTKQNSLIGRLSRQIFLYRSVGLLISGLVMVAYAVAALRESHADDATMAVAGAAASSAFLFKRTFASAHAVGDGAFVRDNFGLDLDQNETFTDARGACASRNVLRALGDWELHYFQSRVTPEGARTVGDWMAFGKPRLFQSSRVSRRVGTLRGSTPTSVGSTTGTRSRRTR